ncbi:serine hydrolase [Fulvivirga sp. 29W222]|uniref:Serine hydrolase n=1 Tax=Fulvivirga marina TaxID=2494733 RepID=A0A937KDH6_9BACT|nr:serine hydrolase domain-containing protein [Fulvivirga marina]MBL6449146.1 serine hydrolase [Fulvivirga marina]
MLVRVTIDYSATVFEAASISKPVFTYFVMKQVEKGVLDIDTPVYKYLPKKEIVSGRRHKLITTGVQFCSGQRRGCGNSLAE